MPPVSTVCTSPAEQDSASAVPAPAGSGRGKCPVYVHDVDFVRFFDYLRAREEARYSEDRFYESTLLQPSPGELA